MKKDGKKEAKKKTPKTPSSSVVKEEEYEEKKKKKKSKKKKEKILPDIEDEQSEEEEHVFEDDWKKAVKSFKAGLVRDKKCFYCNDGLARFHIAEAAKFLKDKKEKKAISEYKKALKQALKGAKVIRHNSGLVTLVDTALYGIGDAKVTLKTYQTLAKKWKTDPLYYAKLGYAHMAAEDYKKAEKSFKA